MTKPEGFPGSWQRAMLPMLLLAELSAGQAHGSALAKSLQERGFGPLKGATLYPALAKLEASGFVETRWEEGQGGPGPRRSAVRRTSRRRSGRTSRATSQLRTTDPTGTKHRPLGEVCRVYDHRERSGIG